MVYRQTTFDATFCMQAPRHQHLLPLKTTAVYDSYWRFAAERQRIFFSRVEGRPPPWTDDPILTTHKFTNAYRASDRVSQYLIRHVIYKGDQSPEEVFFRTLLFKLFNKIETWELFTSAIGTPSAAEFNPEEYDAIMTRAMQQGTRIYSAAYIMPSGGKSNGGRKHSMHLRLLKKMLIEQLPERLLSCEKMSEAFALLRAYPTIGNFLAYQYITDLNYGEHFRFSEMEFVSPGPGAIDGIAKCFSDRGGVSNEDLIRLVTERQEFEFARLGIAFRDLWGRKLQLIDCQNLFCEISKYARHAHPDIAGVSGRTRIKQKYRPHSTSIRPYYPPKWDINDAIGGTDVC